MCFVAAGHLDAHFTFGIHIWDMAAGDLIVREAGGIVCDTSGTIEHVTRCCHLFTAAQYDVQSDFIM